MPAFEQDIKDRHDMGTFSNSAVLAPGSLGSGPRNYEKAPPRHFTTSRLRTASSWQRMTGKVRDQKQSASCIFTQQTVSNTEILQPANSMVEASMETEGLLTDYACVELHGDRHRNIQGRSLLATEGQGPSGACRGDNVLTTSKDRPAMTTALQRPLSEILGFAGSSVSTHGIRQPTPSCGSC